MPAPCQRAGNALDSLELEISRFAASVQRCSLSSQQGPALSAPPGLVEWDKVAAGSHKKSEGFEINRKIEHLKIDHTDDGEIFHFPSTVMHREREQFFHIPYKHDPRFEKEALNMFRKYTPEQTKVFKERFNAYWEATTGVNPHIHFEPHHVPYISPTEGVIQRDYKLNYLISDDGDDLIMVYIGVGIGGELLPRLLMQKQDPGRVKYHAIEPDNWERGNGGMDTLRILEENCKKVIEAYGVQADVRFVCATAYDYFHFIAPMKRISAVILDPPFGTGADDTYEDDLHVATEWVFNEVFLPMVQQGIHTDVFCIKCRYPSFRLQVAWNELVKAYKEREKPRFFTDLIFFDSLQECPYRQNVDMNDLSQGRATKGVFYWVLFAAADSRVHAVRNSSLWVHIVQEGRSVAVDKRDYIQNVRPFPYGAAIDKLSKHHSTKLVRGEEVKDPNRHQILLPEADAKRPGKKAKSKRAHRTDDEIERENQRRERAAHEARRYDADQMHRQEGPDDDGFTLVVKKGRKRQAGA